MFILTWPFDVTFNGGLSGVHNAHSQKIRKPIGLAIACDIMLYLLHLIALLDPVFHVAIIPAGGTNEKSIPKLLLNPTLGTGAGATTTGGLCVVDNTHYLDTKGSTHPL